MEIQHEMILCSCLGIHIYAVHHGSLLRIKEIHLETGNTHLGIMLESLFWLQAKHSLRYPEKHLHTLFGRIRTDAGNVHIIFGSKDIPVLIPPFIDENIRQAVLCGEIYVIEICFGIDPCLELHSVPPESIPPVPARQTGFDPGNVFQFARCSQLIYHIVHGQRFLVGPISKHPPWESAAAGNHIEIIQILSILLVDIVGIRRELSRKTLFGCAEKHPGIIPEVRLHQKQPSLFSQIDINRHKSQPAVGLGHVSGFHILIEILERRPVAIAVGSLKHIRDQHIIGFRKIVFGSFGIYLANIRSVRHEAVCHPVVVCTEFQRPVTFHTERQPVIRSIKLCLTVERRHYVFLFPAFALLHYPGTGPQSPFIYGHGDNVVAHDAFTIYAQGPGCLPAYRYTHGKGAGRTGEIVVLCSQGHGKDYDSQKGKDKLSHVVY